MSNGKTPSSYKTRGDLLAEGLAGLLNGKAAVNEIEQGKGERFP